VWPTGNGDLGNQGIHQMDIARWFLGPQALSPRVFSCGGRLGYVDDANTPNTLFVYHDYPGAPLIFEVRGLPEKSGSKRMDRYKDYRGGEICVVVECEGGDVLVPNYNSAIAYDKSGKEIKRWSGAEDHWLNFLRAVRSRKRDELHAEILQGHLSSALCHTGNISYRVGRHYKPDEIRERIKGDAAAMETFNRMAEHLGRNDVNLSETEATLGAFLEMDPETERFTNDEQANFLLTRNYRQPFVVPEIV
jgi:hypothetical protein